jgi:hypothetical protein
MAGGRRSRSAPPSWQAILEKIESEGRLTLDAVERYQAWLDERLVQSERHIDEKLDGLESALARLAEALDALEKRSI